MLGGNIVSESQSNVSKSPSTAANPSGLKALKEQLFVLAHVQEVDLKIDQLNLKKAALPANLKALDGQLEQLKKNIVLKTVELGEIEKNQRQMKAAMELNQDRMDRAAKKLDNVNNGQEFQAATKEIEQLKKLNGTLEAQQTKLAADTETVKKAAADIQAKADVLQTERDTKASELSGEEGRLDTDLKELLVQRKGYTTQIDAPAMARYDRIRGARGGMGLAAAVSGRCTGCNMMIMPQMYNELQKGRELHSCPTCHRVLYIPTQS